MTNTRTSVAAALAGLALLLTGCGTEDATDGTSGSDAQSTVEPGAGSPSPLADPGQTADALGTVIFNERLDVSPAEYPLQDVPLQIAVASVAELGEAYAQAPGIDEIVAELEGTTLGAGERLFAYLVNSCTTDDIWLDVRGDEVPMIVNGTALLRCAPPTTLVVWVVGDEIPADAKPAQAIQK